MADLPDGLLDTVKSYLRITWEDTATDALVTGYINRGMKRLQDIAGASSLDFTIEDLPRALLLDYCRYANSQALEVFEQNFQAELLELNLRAQAPVIGALVVTVTGSALGGVYLGASPALQDGNLYAYKIGTGLTVPQRMADCVPPDFTVWNGFDAIPAASGQQILLVEVNDEFEAARAGVVTA